MSVSMEFLLGGKAVFTINFSPEMTEKKGRTGNTYLVTKVPASGPWQESYFVKCLTGSDISDPKAFAYLGKLDTFTGQVSLTQRSSFPATAFRVKILNRILARIWSDDHAAYHIHGYTTHHEGLCCFCIEDLTTPKSVKTGVCVACRKAQKTSSKEATVLV